MKPRSPRTSPQELVCSQCLPLIWTKVRLCLCVRACECIHVARDVMEIILF